MRLFLTLGLGMLCAVSTQGCVDTFAACPGWAGQCGVPGVATYCPCMCGSGGSGPAPGPGPQPGPAPGCVDTYAACPGWAGQCAQPGVATYCPCMCGGNPGPAPTPNPSPRPSPRPGPGPSPGPGPRASPTPARSPAPTPPGSNGLVFSPYKDITISLNWNTNTISSKVTGSLQPIAQAMPSNLQTLTLAFATGECGQENWGGVTPSAVAANIPALVAAGKRYIISTGGASSSFTCGSDAGFQTFINTYNTPGLLGFDFDIESGNAALVSNLVARVKAAAPLYPTLRWSFTIATLGMPSTSSSQLNALGNSVMQAISSAGLHWSPNVLVNLMTMDYGTQCTMVNGACDMGQSAVNAAESIHSFFGVPYSSIEITPMIGGNDSQSNVFTISDVSTVTAYVKTKGLGGVHFWSFDRNTDCPPGSASPSCNSLGTAGTLGFTRAFQNGLGL